MLKTFIASIATMTVLATGAMAQTAAYTWTGAGINVPGSSKCPTYKMTINLSVDGSAVKGEFKQEGREQRYFTATLGPGGVFKTKATLGGGNTIDVSGTIKDGTYTVLLDGYCKFDAKLTKK